MIASSVQCNLIIIDLRLFHIGLKIHFEVDPLKRDKRMPRALNAWDLDIPNQNITRLAQNESTTWSPYNLSSDKTYLELLILLHEQWTSVYMDCYMLYELLFVYYFNEMI